VDLSLSGVHPGARGPRRRHEVGSGANGYHDLLGRPSERSTVSSVAQADPLTAKWRRFDAGVDRVGSALGAADSDEMHDAVNAALHALNELWEYWRAKAPSRPGNDDNAFVRADTDGETTAALVHARGAQDHRVFLEHGDLSDAYTDTYHDYYGSWQWGYFSDPTYAERDAWYKAHVAGREVIEPLEAARRWLSARPELSKSNRSA